MLVKNIYPLRFLLDHEDWIQMKYFYEENVE
jgi:hypothetical protein